MSDLRRVFVDELIKICETDKDIILLTGDLGFNILEPFIEKFPEQYINCGCIEQSMIGIAEGLALAGKKPFVYSGVIFLLMRPYEQVRNACFNKLDIKLIGTGASGFLGTSHNLTGEENTEDLLKNLPNIKRFYPKDSEDLKEALVADGLTFIRL